MKKRLYILLSALLLLGGCGTKQVPADDLGMGTATSDPKEKVESVIEPMTEITKSVDMQANNVDINSDLLEIDDALFTLPIHIFGYEIESEDGNESIVYTVENSGDTPLKVTLTTTFYDENREEIENLSHEIPVLAENSSAFLSFPVDMTYDLCNYTFMMEYISEESLLSSLEYSTEETEDSILLTIINTSETVIDGIQYHQLFLDVPEIYEPEEETKIIGEGDDALTVVSMTLAETLIRGNGLSFSSLPAESTLSLESGETVEISLAKPDYYDSFEIYLSIDE